MFAAGVDPARADADLRTAIELHRFGGLARLTWTEFQDLDENVLLLFGEVNAAAEEMRGR